MTKKNMEIKIKIKRKDLNNLIKIIEHLSGENQTLRQGMMNIKYRRLCKAYKEVEKDEKKIN